MGDQDHSKAQIMLIEEFTKVSQSLRDPDVLGAGKLAALSGTAAQMLSTYKEVELIHANVRMAEARAPVEAARLAALSEAVKAPGLTPDERTDILNVIKSHNPKI